MMDKYIKKLLLCSLVVLFAYHMKVGHDQERETLRLGNLVPSAGVVATAHARVLEELVITGKTPLTFGVIESTTTGGEIVITPQNKRIINGGIIVSNTEPFERAHVYVRGNPDAFYNINVPGSLTFVKDGATSIEGVTALKVINFKSYSATLYEETLRGKLNGSGEDVVYVGGTLIVPAETSPGRYSGQVPVTVAY